MADGGVITRLKINDGSETIYTLGGSGGGGEGGGFVESTLLSANWIEDSGRWYQIVDNVSDIKSSTNPVIDIKIPINSTKENTAILLAAWNNIYSAESSNERVIIYSYNKLDIDINIIIKWWGGGSGSGGGGSDPDVDNKIKQAIDALNVTLGGASTNKTITSLSETSGKIAATFEEIAITKSQVTDFPTIPPAVAVKGNAEDAYRTGNVNLTPANIGAAPVSHTHTKSQITDLLGTMQYLGSNITGGSSNDTRTFWQEKGTGYAWFSTKNQLNGQPDQYGFLLNYVNGSEVFQIFLAQKNDREISMRGANASVGAMPSFYKQWSSAKFDFGTSTTTYLRNDGTWGTPTSFVNLNPSNVLADKKDNHVVYTYKASVDCIAMIAMDSFSSITGFFVRINGVNLFNETFVPTSNATSQGTYTRNPTDLCLPLKAGDTLTLTAGGFGIKIFGVK